ncbi:MAG: hypothetical protein RLZZ227_1314 [Pseudomonadota bacterium]
MVDEELRRSQPATPRGLEPNTIVRNWRGLYIEFRRPHISAMQTNDETNWVRLVEESVMIGWEATIIPVSGMPEEKALDLAERLNVTLERAGSEYRFRIPRERWLQLTEPRPGEAIH